MMHKAWSSMEEVPYCFWRSSVKFQGHIALKIVKFDSNWGFPDCNSSLNSPMAMKCCTKLETAKKRCPIVFQCHPLNFKVTRDKTSLILTQIGRFRTIGRSQLSNPSDLPCFFCVCVWGGGGGGGGGVDTHQISTSHGLKNRRFESNLSKITRPVAAIKSLRFSLLIMITFQWYCSVLLNNCLRVGAMLWIFVTKMAKSFSSFSQILWGMCYQG